MDQRLRRRQELVAAPCRRDLQRGVGTDARRDVVKLRAGPAVALHDAVRIGEHQLGGDAAQRLIVGEVGDAGEFLLQRNGEVRGEEAGARDVVADMPRCLRVAPSLDQPAPHDDVRRQLLHDEREQRRVVVVDVGRQAFHMRPGKLVVGLLEIGALERHRPALAGCPDIGQRLFYADPAAGAVDQEDQIEVAVADLADSPLGSVAAEPRADVGQRIQERADTGLVERPVSRMVGRVSHRSSVCSVGRDPRRRRGVALAECRQLGVQILDRLDAVVDRGPSG